MPAKLTLHPPRRASRFLVLRDGETLLVGRDPECGLVLEDPKVSRQQARLRWTGSGWAVEDLDSKNGTSVNGSIATGQDLAHGDWLSFGGLLGRFELASEAEIASLETERLARLETTAAVRRRLAAHLEPVDLLLRFLESAMEMIQAQRGFVLVADPDGVLHPEVAAGFSGEAFGSGFSGSVGALAQALESRASVVVNDARADPALGKRPSVVSQGLGALACVPLRNEDRIVGLLYVDSHAPGRGFTALDLEILESLADHVALVIAGMRLDRRIRRLFGRPEEGPLLEALERQVGTLAASTQSSGSQRVR